MLLTLFDAMRPADRERLAALEKRADTCEREAVALTAEARACWQEARRIRRHYEQMVAVFGLKECVTHVRRGAQTEIIEVP